MERPEVPGHLTIGDVGYLDEDGYLFLTDRRNDMVISGGVNIYPAEIVACLLELNDVRDAAVLGVGDDEFGERVVARVELSPGSSLEVADIQARTSRTGWPATRSPRRSDSPSGCRRTTPGSCSNAGSGMSTGAVPLGDRATGRGDRRAKIPPKIVVDLSAAARQMPSAEVRKCKQNDDIEH